jgi:hypothetical protein
MEGIRSALVRLESVLGNIEGELSNLREGPDLSCVDSGLSSVAEAISGLDFSPPEKAPLDMDEIWRMLRDTVEHRFPNETDDYERTYRFTVVCATTMGEEELAEVDMERLIMFFPREQYELLRGTHREELKRWFKKKNKEWNGVYSGDDSFAYRMCIKEVGVETGDRCVGLSLAAHVRFATTFYLGPWACDAGTAHCSGTKGSMPRCTKNGGVICSSCTQRIACEEHAHLVPDGVSALCKKCAGENDWAAALLKK